MNLSSRLRVILCFLISGLLLFGCSPAAGVQDIEITFDGERCQYEGPEAIVEGQVVMILNDPTDHENLHLHVATFAEGKTWQDLVKFYEELGQIDTDVGPPQWVGDIEPTSVDGDPSKRFQKRYFREWEFSLEAGSYGIMCAAHRGVKGDWLAAPLEVRP